jgi:hypothetical protein
MICLELRNGNSNSLFIAMANAHADGFDSRAFGSFLSIAM